MSSSAVKPLRLGRSDFSALRLRNCIYVDKTDFLCALCENDDKVLLVRPRRFGKSLLVSAFASLFRYGLREFQGLKIEKTWTDCTYNVVRLDFSLTKDFSSLEQFLAQFNGMLADAVAEAGLVIESAPGDPVGSFQTLLSRQPQSSLVLLIDEYDAPLTAPLDNRELFEAVQQQLSRFYAAVKSREGCLRCTHVGCQSRGAHRRHGKRQQKDQKSSGNKPDDHSLQRRCAHGGRSLWAS